MRRFKGVMLLLIITALLAVSCDSPTNSLVNDNANVTSSELTSESLAKKAGPNAVFNLDFSDASDAGANSPGSAGWVTDRYSPESVGTSLFDGDDRLKINIDESGPLPPAFTRYQGIKYQDAGGSYWNAEANAKFSYSFYIDPSWEGDGVPQETGVWPVLGNSGGFISAYPILAYQDSDANEDGEAGFRAYVYNPDFTAEWIYLGLPKQLKIDPAEGGWVHVEAQLHKTEDGSALKWRINNKLVLDERGYNTFASSTQFLEFIFNSINFGTDQDYYYDDVVLTNPGHAGK